MFSFIAVLANIETYEPVTTIVVEADTIEECFVKAEEEANKLNLYAQDLVARD